jgi:hypothetical protein
MFTWHHAYYLFFFTCQTMFLSEPTLHCFETVLASYNEFAASQFRGAEHAAQAPNIGEY